MSPYIPWDISYLDKFMTYLKFNIGNATFIGILIFAVVFGIGLVVMIVKTFTRGGK